MSAILTQPLQPSTNLLTAEQFFEQYENRRFELVDGHAVEVVMPGLRHGVVSNWIGYYLTHYIVQNPIGRVTSNDTFIVTRRNPDGVRGADNFFVSYSKLPKEQMTDGPIEVAPELVFEVLSPSDTWKDAISKMLEYLNAGVQIVAVFDPKSETVVVYRPKERPATFEKGQTLTFPDVLPGFEVPVAKFFE